MSVADVDLSPIRRGSAGSLTHCHHTKHALCSRESILIYLSVSGSVIPMRILDSDSIASVKLRIQICNGFVVRKQKLVLGGRELARNDSLVRDYGVTRGNVLHLVLKLSDLLLITVRTTCGEELEFHVNRHRNVGYIKKKIAKKGLVDVSDHEIFYEGEKLDDQRLIDDICKDDDHAAIRLLVKKSAKVRAKPVEKNFELSVDAGDLNERGGGEGVNKGGENGTGEIQGKDFLFEPLVVNREVKFPEPIWDMIRSTFDGLERGNEPIRSSEGTGGTYLMQDSLGLSYISVFKPIDEEPMAANNPNGLPVSSDGQGLKKGTRVGGGALREVAAYILDHPKNGPREATAEVMGFAGVPPTVMVRCAHKGFNYPEGYAPDSKHAKIGSLQMFMRNAGSCEDIGPGAFPVDEVHKICVFDVRMANADRHAGNILIGRDKDGQTLLLPIDHGYCLPENFEDCTFDWLYWPQAKEPFSPEIIKYIKSLDSHRDIELLRYHGWDVPPEVSRTLHVTTMLLKKGVERGLTPYAIGSILCRETVNKESAIETMVKEAQESLLPGMSEAAFLETVSQVMDVWLDGLPRK